MSRAPDSTVTAVLGPTNTGKTHLAVERMCGHSSGIIGFPLRLLAREVYDRVVAIKGASRVALITGEERIAPPDARWFLCTVESMPRGDGVFAGAGNKPIRDVGFVAIDEAQLGADPERGHVFTDRLLNARGRDETMILGSDALRPVLKALVPEADIQSRPRFSTLSYAGARKLSRLPRRSAIVAFSAEEVYAVAEMIRRTRGGAAVVMGALSPRTRNAQVAMFQAGEVDYLVATDAIGMGLNMDVAHVAFASLHKFDGRRQRRLTIAEMAQIAGRAGRHQKDGTFGALVEQGPDAFTAEEVEAIEAHRVPPLDRVYWRDGAPDMSSVDALIESLEAKPSHPMLAAAPQATDLGVLKRLAEEGWVRDRTRSPAMVARLWAACGLPDFRKTGVDPHARFVSRLFRHLSEGQGHVPHQWFADEIARLDNVTGDVETIAGRIAAARSWAYIAQRSDWLADPAHWAGRARVLEERLSDALHAGLTQRFVDRRTTVLMRQIGQGASALPVLVADDGAVSVDGEDIGRLDGFRFIVAHDARLADKRLLLAAAEKRLVDVRARRARALVAAPDADFALHAPAGARPGIAWQLDGKPDARAIVVATLTPGRGLLRPLVQLDRALECLSPKQREAVHARLAAWLSAMVGQALPGLAALDGLARDTGVAAPLRAVAVAVIEGGGVVPRVDIAPSLAALSQDDRRALRRAGITVGTLDVFDARLLKPRPASIIAALVAARGGLAMPLAVPGVACLTLGAADKGAPPGFRRLGAQALRVDLVERIARAAHDARLAAGRRGEGAGAGLADPMLAISAGLQPAAIVRLMLLLGFRQLPRRPAGTNDKAEPRLWQWRGPRPVARGTVEDAMAVLRPGNAFAQLAVLRADVG